MILQRNQNQAICDRLIINPDGLTYTWFNYFLIGLSLFSTMSSAFYACFGMPEGNRTLQGIDYTMEIFFLIDIILSFFKEFLDEETHKPVRDCKVIAKRYLMSIFFFDLVALSTTPIQLIADARTPEDMDLAE